ncbi:MAG: ribosomal protein S18-alanine N-acetyltransferase [Bacilli bacterium]
MNYLFNIREMTLLDLNEIEKIESECFSTDKWDVKQLKEELTDKEFKCPIVIEIYTPNGYIIVGYAIYYVTFSSASIAKIAIKKEYRHNGLAKSLMEEIEKDCYVKKVMNLTLEVRISNVSAINLYKKCGFQEVVIKPHYYSDGEDAIYMIKEVKSQL